MPSKRPVLTLAYASSDTRVHHGLRKHLQALVHRELIWALDMQQPSNSSALGRACIRAQLLHTNLYVPILSPDFIDSRARQWQLEQAVEHERAGRLSILPVIARDIDIDATPLAGREPVRLASWGGPELDSALCSLAREIRLGFEPGVACARPVRPRRILCVFATPTNCDSLHLGAEQRAIQTVLRGCPHIDAQYRPAATLSDVQQAMFEADYDLVHFAGHHEPERGLVLEGADGRSEVVDADCFVQMVRSFRSVRSLVLNACDTLDVARRNAQLDYVIAMQGATYDPRAIGFSEFFYRALAHGKDLVTAFEHGKCGAQSPGPHLLGTAVHA